MRDYLTPLLQLQRFFIPALIGLLLWSIWKLVWHKDLGVGLALYLGLVIIVDGYLNTGLFLPGLEKGSIRYSEICAAIILFSRQAAPPRSSPFVAIRLAVGVYFGLLLLSAFRADPVMPALMEFRIRIVPQIIAFAIALRGLEETRDFQRFSRSMMVLTLIFAAFVFWDLFFDRWLLASDMLSKPEY